MILKGLLVGLSFMIFSRIFGYIFYSVIFHATLMEHLHIYRDMHSPHWIYLTLFEAVIGFALFYIFIYLKKLKSDISPFMVAIGIFLLTRFTGEIANYFMLPYSINLMFAGMLSGFFSFITTAGIIYIINKKMLAK